MFYSICISGIKINLNETKTKMNNINIEHGTEREAINAGVKLNSELAVMAKWIAIAFGFIMAFAGMMVAIGGCSIEPEPEPTYTTTYEYYYYWDLKVNIFVDGDLQNTYSYSDITPEDLPDISEEFDFYNQELIDRLTADMADLRYPQDLVWYETELELSQNTYLIQVILSRERKITHVHIERN